MIPPFPFAKAGNYPPIDGLIQRVPKFCKAKDRPQCKAHYKTIANRPGFHTCPFGFTSYCEPPGRDSFVYTCLRVAGHHNRKMLRDKLADDDVPVIQETTVVRAASHWMPDDAIQAKILETEQNVGRAMIFLNGTVHEIRKLNSHTKVAATELSKLLDQLTGISWQDEHIFKKTITQVFHCASLISMRLSSTFAVYAACLAA